MRRSNIGANSIWPPRPLLTGDELGRGITGTVAMIDGTIGMPRVNIEKAAQRRFAMSIQANRRPLARTAAQFKRDGQASPSYAKGFADAGAS